MNNVTMLDDLPNLTDLEMKKQNPAINNGLSMIPPSEISRYQKFIRNSGVSTPKQSGMNVEQFQQNNSNIGHLQNFPHDRQPLEYQPYEAKKVHENFQNSGPPFLYKNMIPRNIPMRLHVPSYEEDTEVSKENNFNKKYIKHNHSCIEIAEHTSNCKVCSKLYSNNNTIFIFIIIFQAVVLLLLLKRILETDK